MSLFCPKKSAPTDNMAKPKDDEEEEPRSPLMPPDFKPRVDEPAQRPMNTQMFKRVNDEATKLQRHVKFLGWKAMYAQTTPVDEIHIAGKHGLDISGLPHEVAKERHKLDHLRGFSSHTH